MARAKKTQKRKRFIGYVVLCEGRLLTSRKKYNGGMTPVRKGEAPTICGRKEDAHFLIKQTVEWLGENTFFIVPLRYPVLKIMLFQGKRRVSVKKHVAEV